MLGLSFIGEPWVVLVVGLSGYLLAVKRQNLAVEHVFSYTAVAYGLNILLKLALHRRRPHGRVVRTLGLQSYSFPSGHAFGSLILYGLLAYLSLKYLAQPLAAFITIIALIGIFLNGVARVYLGSHFPSDVLAGWCLAAISLVVVIGLAF